MDARLMVRGDTTRSRTREAAAVDGLLADCDQLRLLLAEALAEGASARRELEELRLEHSELRLRHAALQDRQLAIHGEEGRGSDATTAELVVELKSAEELIRRAASALHTVNMLAGGGDASSGPYSGLLAEMEIYSSLFEETISGSSDRIPA